MWSERKSLKTIPIGYTLPSEAIASTCAALVSNARTLFNYLISSTVFIDTGRHCFPSWFIYDHTQILDTSCPHTPCDDKLRWNAHVHMARKIKMKDSGEITCVPNKSTCVFVCRASKNLDRSENNHLFKCGEKHQRMESILVINAETLCSSVRTHAKACWTDSLWGKLTLELKRRTTWIEG